MSIIGILFLAYVIVWIIRSDAVANMFPDQMCGYCDLYIHWDRGQHCWVHEDGSISAPLPPTGLANHIAHPVGVTFP